MTSSITFWVATAESVSKTACAHGFIFSACVPGR